jgi:hypothetical protein
MKKRIAVVPGYEVGDIAYFHGLCEVLNEADIVYAESQQHLSEAMEKQAFDLVLFTDIPMRHSRTETTIEEAIKLRAQGVKILILIGSSASSVPPKAADLVIVKPLDLEDLHREVTNLLQ